LTRDLMQELIDRADRNKFQQVHERLAGAAGGRGDTP
jgi:hypothetical protein